MISDWDVDYDGCDEALMGVLMVVKRSAEVTYFFDFILN